MARIAWGRHPEEMTEMTNYEILAALAVLAIWRIGTAFMTIASEMPGQVRARERARELAEQKRAEREAKQQAALERANERGRELWRKHPRIAATAVWTLVWVIGTLILADMLG